MSIVFQNMSIQTYNVILYLSTYKFYNLPLIHCSDRDTYKLKVVKMLLSFSALLPPSKIQEEKPPTFLTRFIKTIFGEAKKATNKTSYYDDDREAHDWRLASLKETRKWKLFMNCNAAGVIVVLAFLLGFFH